MSQSIRNFIAAVLIIAMLCAHWAGLVHRVEHADESNATSLSASDFLSGSLFNLSVVSKDVSSATVKADHHTHTDSESEEDSHSCLLFDAAALGTSVYSSIYQLAPLPGKQVLALWEAFASWQSPFTCHFSSRAPPRA